MSIGQISTASRFIAIFYDFATGTSYSPCNQTRVSLFAWVLMLVAGFSLQINLGKRDCAVQVRTRYFPGATEKTHRIIFIIFCLRADIWLEWHPNANDGMTAQLTYREVRTALQRRPKNAFSVASRLLHKDSRHLASTDHLLARNYLYYTGQTRETRNATLI